MSDELERRDVLSRRLVLLLPLAACGENRRSLGRKEQVLRTATPSVGRRAEEVRNPAPKPSAATAASSVAKPRRKESPHVLHVPAADIAAGGAKAYSVFGDGHTHPITVDAGAMAKLAASKFALVKSGPGGPDQHAHWVSVYAAT